MIMKQIYLICDNEFKQVVKDITGILEKTYSVIHITSDDKKDKELWIKSCDDLLVFINRSPNENVMEEIAIARKYKKPMMLICDSHKIYNMFCHYVTHWFTDWIDYEKYLNENNLIYK